MAQLISNFHTILYLTGFETLSPTEREALLLIDSEKKWIITDGRYAGAKSERYTLTIMRPGEGMGKTLKRLCVENAISELQFESDNLTEHEAEALKKIGVSVSGATGLYSELRSVKNNVEIEKIRTACEIGDTAFRKLIPLIHLGQYEKQIAWILEKLIREELQSELSFDPIIAFDNHAAISHYNTKKGSGVIHGGSIILVDFGVKKDSYCSDMTRMITVGNAPEQFITDYKLLLAAQEKTVQSVETIHELKEIDAFCRNELTVNGLPSYPHSTGHGIGLEVHELPRISAQSADIKKPGQVFTIEPGIYRDTLWGIRIEDTVVITSTGSAEPLTRYSKELVHLP